MAVRCTSCSVAAGLVVMGFVATVFVEMALVKAVLLKTIVTLLLLVSVSPLAQGGAYRLYGAGSYTCAYWTQERALPGWQYLGQWVLGFVSAYGHYHGNVLSRADAGEITAFMDNYCRQNPMSGILDAAAALVEELKNEELKN